MSRIAPFALAILLTVMAAYTIDNHILGVIGTLVFAVSLPTTILGMAMNGKSNDPALSGIGIFFMVWGGFIMWWTGVQ